MSDPSDQELLARYAQVRDEAAFTELVHRRLDLVHSAALRLVVDTHLAEDVTQAVFVALARQAAQISRRLAEGIPLSGWMHLTTRNIAAKVVRSEVRRRDREKEAFAMLTNDAHADDAVWARIAPHLDHALAELPEPDREALLWRFFDRQTAREIGVRLGTSEDAAQKRVSRALEKLRTVFVARGLAVPAASFGGVLMVHAVQTAPISLARSITAAALAGAGGLLPSTGLFSLMNSTKLKTVAAALVGVAITAIIHAQHRQNQQLQAELLALHAAVEAQGSAPPTVNNPTPDSALTDDLLRLRGEATQFRREVFALRAENQLLKGVKPAADQYTPADEQEREAFKQRGIAKMVFAKLWAQAFIDHANEHGGMFPSSFEDARMHFVAEVGDFPEGTEMPSEQDFEIVFNGRLAQIANRDTAMVIRERAPFSNFRRPGYSRTYGMANGQSMILSNEDGNFEEYDRQPVLKPETGGVGSGP